MTLPPKISDFRISCFSPVGEEILLCKISGRVMTLPYIANKKHPLYQHTYKRRKIAVPLFFITLPMTQGQAGCYPSLPDALSSLSPTRASSRRPRLSISSDGITLSVQRDMKLG